jgi:hypothetical protein
MDKSQILNLPAGPEMDKLIGLHVLKLELNRHETDWIKRDGSTIVNSIAVGSLCFSTDIEAAREILSFVNKKGQKGLDTSDPLAICRAALLERIHA